MSSPKNASRFLRSVWSGAALAAALTSLSNSVAAQSANAQELLQRHAFVFIAEWASGNQGPRHVLTPTYELRITSDSVEGRLPFYGRIYSPSDAYTMAAEGFTFRSRLKSYDLRETKKGNWQLVVQATAGSNVQKLTFTISRDGSARMSVNSASRDPMYYDGRIIPAQTP